MTHELTITREYPVSVERLFEAWSTPRLMRQWFAPGEMTPSDVQVEFRVGGRYRIAMQGESEHVATGEYRAIRVNEAIVCTWQWEGSDLETALQLDFKRLANDRSQLTLTHTAFPDEGLRDQHSQGWNGCLANFAKFIDTAAAA